MPSPKASETERKTFAPVLEQISSSPSERLVKRAPTVEKNVLPSAEMVARERQELGVINSLNAFNKDNLKQTVTNEKGLIPDADVLKKEKLEYGVISSVSEFNRENLKPTETVEKNVKPSA